MANPDRSNEICDLKARVDAIIIYWKLIAQRNFKNVRPFSDAEEFEESWPKTLDNFFLAETIRTARLLRALFAVIPDN